MDREVSRGNRTAQRERRKEKGERQRRRGSGGGWEGDVMSHHQWEAGRRRGGMLAGVL